MLRLRVDFNSMSDEGVLCVSSRGRVFVVGERLAVFDEGTDVFEAVVVEVSESAAYVEVSNKIVEF